MKSVSSKKLCSKCLTSSASATIVGNNNNLLADVLYCLPVKYLCAFKTVSKQWQSLISDPSFRRNYNLRSRRLSTPAIFMSKQLIRQGCRIEIGESKVLIMDEGKDINFVPFNTPSIVDDPRITFKQSCNGLVLCNFHDNNDDFGLSLFDINENSFHNHIIYNPSMKRCKTLPAPLLLCREDSGYLQGVTLAFDPAKSSYYQVVGVSSIDTNTGIIHHIQIYSSKTDSWRTAGNPFPLPPPARLSHSGVYWNGSVHWMDHWTATLHYFDVHCELMKTLAMPTQPCPDSVYNRRIVYFNECRGHIHLMEMRKDDMPRYDIWEMRKDYTGWNVKYYADLTPLPNVYPSILISRNYFYDRHEFHVLLVEDGIDSSRLILSIGKKVVSFDLKNKSFKEMYDVNPDVLVEGFEYMETFAHA